MSEDTIRLATVARILRRRRRLLAVLTVLGALVGFGASLLLPPRYTASASVLLPGQWEERELLTQVGIATSSVVVDRVAAALGRPEAGEGPLRERVGAGAAEGNIVRISGTAATPERAQRLADEVARQFVMFAARLGGGATDSTATSGPEALRQQVVQTNRRITDLANAADPGRSVESVQARTALERLRSTLEEAMEKLAAADPTTSTAGMVVMGPAPRPTGAAPPTRTHLVAGGALLFLLVTVVAHLGAARANRRPRTGPELAAALGCTLLGTVDVPDGPRARRTAGQGPWPRLRRLLGADTRWDVPPPRRSGGEADRRLRYQRVCARLRDQLPPPKSLLVVVPAGDDTARRAADQLVSEAAATPSPSTPDEKGPLLRVFEVGMERPTVPECDTGSGALVVLGAGHWTAQELAEVAGACADGGHEVVGVVVAGTVRARPAPSDGPQADEAAPVLAVGGRGTGGPR
ncbi:Wzz/FepE/Etk N-terminal domain-containing protein [Streptomyces sp. NPDC091272]|uniref:Wzz/FepE/Etk N-terminal domain-containing protein n=1 Tax=Streptomyces sp. NPDC091272 TaxID=3365981 RepID=UPI00380B0F15